MYRFSGPGLAPSTRLRRSASPQALALAGAPTLTSTRATNRATNRKTAPTLASTVLRTAAVPSLPRRQPIPPAELRRAAGEAVAALKLLGNEDRLLLLCQLSAGEMCVSELEESLDIRQPTLSQQLAVLRGDGVVATRRDGKRIYYRITDPRLLDVLGLLYRLYCPRE